MYSKLNKFAVTAQARLKHRKQCLKNKNILFENDHIQLGCKLMPFYDFYSSKHVLQMQIFVGNKTNRKLAHFSLAYKGTANLQLYLEEKARQAGQNSQYKERVMVQCTDFQQQIVLVLDFQSELLTLQSVLVPLSFYSFCMMVPHALTTLPLTSSYSQLLDLLSTRFQYIQQIHILLDPHIFKKGIKEMPKYFPNLTQHTENLLASQFNIQTLTQQYVIVIYLADDANAKISLAGNSYRYFQQVLAALKFLLAE